MAAKLEGRVAAPPRIPCMRPAIAAWALIFLSLSSAPPAHAQALSAWNETASKQAILKFVTEVTTPGAATFVAPEDRIAVFDNDGTL